MAGSRKLSAVVLMAFVLASQAADPLSLPTPVVEIEEDVYRYEPANNGAGPMWCHGSTCLVRADDQVYASGLETLAGVKPLNNCRWILFRRDHDRWSPWHTDAAGRTREPSPLAVFSDGRLFLSANPTLATAPDAYAGPARPTIVEFSGHPPGHEPQTHLPGWRGQPEFTEHSYRSFAADGPRHELILFQNVGYTHAEWAFRDRRGQWAAQGQLKWPWGAEYAKPQPIRVCYPNVALKNRAVHFCGVSDIIEPNPMWREFKKRLTGREWDYDFRRLFYTWTPDITRGAFRDWVEIASRERTCGWITPGDLWVDPRGVVHILWTERAIDERLKEKFFPQAAQSQELNYARIRDGKVVFRRTLARAGASGSQEVPGRGRFHVLPDHRLLVLYYVSGRDSSGRAIAENRLLEIRPDGGNSPAIPVPLRRPFTEFFTATVRAGSAPSDVLDLLGSRTGDANSISYARIRLKP
jgi:hypothetical protein